MIRQIVPQFFTTDIPGTLAYYQDKLGFEYLGTWQDPPVYAIVARDRTRHKARLDLRRRYMRRAVRPHICPDWRWAAQRESESRAAQGLEFVRELANTPWHSREFVVKDCDGRLLAFGSNL